MPPKFLAGDDPGITGPIFSLILSLFTKPTDMLSAARFAVICTSSPILIVSLSYVIPFAPPKLK
jgi:hypothetical protein